VLSRSNWNLEVLAFEERGKPENPKKNLSKQERKPPIGILNPGLKIPNP